MSRDRVRGIAHERGYGATWRRKRASFLRRYPLCVRCEGSNRTEAATVVDHIIPLHDGGTHDVENLQPLCRDCHAAKTATDLRKRRSGAGGDQGGL